MALPVGFYGSLQWIGWLSLLDEVALNHWNTQLAAVGFAMLLRMIWTKKLAVYFFVGFFLTTYLGIPTLGIAIAGVLYCIIRYYTLIDSPKNLMNQNENMAMEGDDLFND